MQIRPEDRDSSASSRAATGAPVGAQQNVADVGLGGWAAQRLAVVEQADGVCACCGATGAHAAFRNWDSARFPAAHTRCVVLGPAISTPGR
jgi:hypothetical protein